LMRATDAERDPVEIDYLRDAVPKAIVRCTEGLRRVAEIVRALNEFGQSNGVEMGPADLNQCLRSTLSACESEYARVADVATTFGELPDVECDPAALGHVFRNLIVNAGHAVADVVRGTDRRGRIAVTTARDGDNVVISIEDTGAGISTKVRSRVFDPFFTTKAVGSGAGLGLSVARSIVEKHNGTLTFETEMGRGTRFVVRLPVRPATRTRQPA